MQSENFDNKVRQAAEQHHPNYDEKAWSKMEKLLNRHLPQKDDRRRIIFLLLFFLLLGGGIWLFISKPWEQNDRSLSTTTTSSKNETQPSDKATKGTTARSGESSPVILSPAEEKKIIGPDGEGTNKLVKDKVFTGIPGEVMNSSVPDKLFRRKENKTDQLETDITNAATTRKDDNLLVNKNADVAVPETTNDKVARNESPKTKIDQPSVIDIPANKTVETKEDKVIEQPKKTGEKETAKKSGGKKNNLFFFSISAGPDISSVGFEHPGKVELLTGAGFGYTFKKRWTIRTGFYTARKIYSASKYEYKPSGGMIYPTTYLDKIDADCKVYEIPLNLSYNFSKSAKHSLFVTVGLSSFIMKKEVYDYRYTYPGPPPTTSSHRKTVNNENKHYFSVLTLSGGYQRQINKTFSIAAEPYVKLPLAGVGFGNVKLNSAGILFSVNIAPFQSVSKK